MSNYCKLLMIGLFLASTGVSSGLAQNPTIRSRQTIATQRAGGQTVELDRLGLTVWQVTIGTKTVLEDREDETLALRGPYSAPGRDYVLIEESLGGNACESNFQIIEIQAGQILVSPRFGSCSADARVTVNGTELHVVTPAFKAGRAVTTTFVDGRFHTSG